MPYKIGDKIGKYTLSSDLTKAGQCQWGFCTYGKEEYFIKHFNKYIYPGKKASGSKESKKAKKKRCELFEARHKLITKSLFNLGDGGLLVKHLDFFTYPEDSDSNRHYFKVTHKVSLDSIVQQVHKLPEKDRLFTMMTAAFAVSLLHKNKIVHFDIKPRNILFHKYGKQTISKIIDFDDSFFVGDSINYDDITADTTYYSPELHEYKNTKGATDTPGCQSDIFSLGLVFCEYWNGNLPDHKHGNAAEAVLKGKKLVLSKTKVSRVRTNMKFKSKTYEKPSIIKLIEDMLSLTPAKRPTAGEVHSQLKNMVDKKIT